MTFNVRRDFPILSRTIDGQPIVYLDSAATALRPTQVTAAVAAFADRFTANIHRGKHSLSEEASLAYDTARRQVARHLGLGPREVIFTSGSTHGMNLIAAGLQLQANEVVMASPFDHHSTILPWVHAGAKIAWFENAPGSPINVAEFELSLERTRPRVVVLTWVSNVTGIVQPMRELCACVREAGAKVVIDAAQAAPHLDVADLAGEYDFLVFSGHKMLAPTGVGVLAGNEAALELLRPVMVGGGAIDRVDRGGFTWKELPLRLESGTPPIEGAVGLGAAIEYLDALPSEERLLHEASLVDAIRQGEAILAEHFEPIHKTGSRIALTTLVPRDGLVAMDHLALAMSDTHKAMVRTGFQCAHMLFDEVGNGSPGLRLSAFIYNTPDEILAACQQLLAFAERVRGA